MRALDRQTIDAGFVPALQLMENAGRCAAREAARMLGTVTKARIEILCGKGNNGGDGFVVARELATQGASVRVHLTHAPAELSPDARTNFEKLAGAGVASAPVADTAAQDSLLAECLAAADLSVDALLGTGVERRLEGRLAALVDLMNRNSTRTLALDVPTGIDASSGAVLGTAVRAHCTVTFGLPKLGLALHPGRSHTGRLVVADIGFPRPIVDAVETPWFWVDPEHVRARLPVLEPTAHKYARGSVLVIAGSRAYPGAAALAAEAAQRAGAGMVHLVSTESNRTILEARLREVIIHAAPETEAGTCSAATLALVRELLPRADAVALGPGLGTQTESVDWVRTLLAQLDKPAVVDADGLLAMPQPPHPGARVLTPHVGELARWLERDSAAVREARAESAAEVAATHGVVVLAKGAPTFVVDADGTRHVNSSGNVGLASGGSGDVLTGIVGSLLAQGLNAVDAACVGAYLHGAAADHIVARGSPRSLVAGDLLTGIGAVFRDLESSR
jgi:NAD(P)H-hydrate epimerase